MIYAVYLSAVKWPRHALRSVSTQCSRQPCCCCKLLSTVLETPSANLHWDARYVNVERHATFCLLCVVRRRAKQQQARGAGVQVPVLGEQHLLCLGASSWRPQKVTNSRPRHRATRVNKYIKAQASGVNFSHYTRSKGPKRAHIAGAKARLNSHAGFHMLHGGSYGGVFFELAEAHNRC